MKDIIFVSSNGGYVPYLNAFFNSLEKHKGDRELLVYLVHWDMPVEYLFACTSKFSFEVRPVEAKPNEYTDASFSNMEVCKSSRYHYMKEICAQENFDVACLMDADLMVVSPEFFNLFDMVRGTDLLLGSNERFKWNVGPQYHYKDGTPLFKEPTKLYKFHCNTPLFLGKPGSKQWQEVLEIYLKTVYQAVEDHPKKGPTKVGDIFAWNFSVCMAGMESKVLLLPTETTTQMHQTAYRKWTRLQKEKDYYYIFGGDPVLSLHGRCGQESFGTFKDSSHIGASQGDIDKVNEIFRNEWFDLNFRQKVKLNHYISMKPYWKKWLENHGWPYE